MSFTVDVDQVKYGIFTQVGLDITVRAPKSNSIGSIGNRIGYLRILPQGGSLAPDNHICTIYIQPLAREVQAIEAAVKHVFPSLTKGPRPTPERDQWQFYLTGDEDGDRVNTTFTLQVAKADAKKALETIKNIEGTVFHSTQDKWFSQAVAFAETNHPGGNSCIIC